MESAGEPSAETESENKSPDTETQKDSPETTVETETPQSENKDTPEEAAVEKTPTPVKKPEKINIILKPVGDAPIIKQKLWAVEADRPISSVIAFVRKYLKKPSGEGLFFFVNQAFAPSPDQLVRNLYECFGADGKLVLHYSTTTAWG